MGRWIGFHVLIGLLLLLDLGVFHRKKHAIPLKEAVLWSGFWICLALLFNGLIYAVDGPEKALEFFTGYVVEKSLSVDNLFIFLVIFSHFRVPSKYQHTVLFAGIVGALIMRLTLILVGVTLVHYFHFVFYLFALILAITAARLIFHKAKEIDVEERLVVRWAKRVFPMTHEYHDGHFSIMKRGRRLFTPLFLVLIVIECTDLIFAVDSIPAIFAITLDPFIVYTSNVFALLGLRSLYFALSHFIERFRYLKIGLGFVLLFIATKMGMVDIYTIPLGLSLSIIAAILAVTVILSLMRPLRRPRSRERG